MSCSEPAACVCKGAHPCCYGCGPGAGCAAPDRAQRPSAGPVLRVAAVHLVEQDRAAEEPLPAPAPPRQQRSPRLCALLLLPARDGCCQFDRWRRHKRHPGPPRPCKQRRHRPGWAVRFTHASACTAAYSCLVFAQTQTEPHVFSTSLARAGAYFYEMTRVVQAAGACTTAVIAPELDTASNGCAHPPSVTRLAQFLRRECQQVPGAQCASVSERGMCSGHGLSSESRAGLPVERSALKGGAGAGCSTGPARLRSSAASPPSTTAASSPSTCWTACSGARSRRSPASPRRPSRQVGPPAALPCIRPARCTRAARVSNRNCKGPAGAQGHSAGAQALQRWAGATSVAAVNGSPIKVILNNPVRHGALSRVCRQRPLSTALCQACRTACRPACRPARAALCSSRSASPRPPSGGHRARTST